MIKYILTRLKKPTWVEITISSIVTFLIGNLTGEIVSRPYNSFFQGFMLLLTLAASILTFRLIAMWTTDYVTNKDDK